MNFIIKSTKPGKNPLGAYVDAGRRHVPGCWGKAAQYGEVSRPEKAGYFKMVLCGEALKQNITYYCCVPRSSIAGGQNA